MLEDYDIAILNGDRGEAGNIIYLYQITVSQIGLKQERIIEDLATGKEKCVDNDPRYYSFVETLDYLENCFLKLRRQRTGETKMKRNTILIVTMMLISLFIINSNAELINSVDEINIEVFTTEELEELQRRITEELQKRSAGEDKADDFIQDFYPGVYISSEGFKSGDYIFICEKVLGGGRGEIVVYNNDFDYRYDNKNYVFRVSVAEGEAIHISAERFYVIDVRGLQGKLITQNTNSKLYPGVYISSKDMLVPGEYVLHCESITGTEPGKIVIYNSTFDYRYAKNQPIFEHNISVGDSITISARRMYVIEVVGANGTIEAK